MIVYKKCILLGLVLMSPLCLYGTRPVGLADPAGTPSAYGYSVSYPSFSHYTHESNTTSSVSESTNPPPFNPDFIPVGGVSSSIGTAGDASAPPAPAPQSGQSQSMPVATSSYRSRLRQFFSWNNGYGKYMGIGAALSGGVYALGTYCVSRYYAYHINVVCNRFEEMCQHEFVRHLHVLYEALDHHKRENNALLNEQEIQAFAHLLSKPQVSHARQILMKLVQELRLIEKHLPQYRIKDVLKKRIQLLQAKVCTVEQLMNYLQQVEAQHKSYCILYDVYMRLQGDFQHECDAITVKQDLEIPIRQRFATSSYYLVEYLHHVNESIQILEAALASIASHPQSQRMNLLQLSRCLLDYLRIMQRYAAQHPLYNEQVRRREEVLFAQQKLTELERAHREQERLKAREIAEIARGNDLAQRKNELLEKKVQLLTAVRQQYTRLHDMLERIGQQPIYERFFNELRAIYESLSRLERDFERLNNLY